MIDDWKPSPYKRNSESKKYGEEEINSENSGKK